MDHRIAHTTAVTLVVEQWLEQEIGMLYTEDTDNKKQLVIDL